MWGGGGVFKGGWLMQRGGIHQRVVCVCVWGGGHQRRVVNAKGRDSSKGCVWGGVSKGR